MGLPHAVTRILADMRAGHPGAPQELMSFLYRELLELAGAELKKDRKGHTLQPTALVHESYLRLMQDEDPSWENRAHFLGAASVAMRRVLVDYARGRGAQKRGGGARRVSIAAEELGATAEDPLDVIALDDALEELGRIDPRKSRLVELRFFGGLGFAEAARVLEISEITAKRDWTFAKAWLYRRIAGARASG